MTTDHDQALTDAESWYVAGVDAALGPLPRTVRRGLLDAVRQNLAERTDRSDTASSRDLERSLGSPAAYAAELIADADAADPGSIARARRMHHTAVALIVIAAVAVLGGGAWVFSWWQTFDPDLGAPALRVCAGEPSETACDQTGFVTLSPAEMMRIPCAPDRGLVVTVGLVARHHVTVTGASIPGVGGVGNPTFSTQMLRLDDVTPLTRATPSERATPAEWPVELGGDSRFPEIRFRLTTCPTSSPDGPASPGSDLVLSGIAVDYRALGLDHTTTVPLIDRLAISVPGGQ